MKTTIKTLKTLVRAVLQESKYGRLMENKFLNSFKIGTASGSDAPYLEDEWFDAAINANTIELSALPSDVANGLKAVGDELLADSVEWGEDADPNEIVYYVLDKQLNGQPIYGVGTTDPAQAHYFTPDGEYFGYIDT